MGGGWSCAGAARIASRSGVQCTVFCHHCRGVVTGGPSSRGSSSSPPALTCPRCRGQFVELLTESDRQRLQSASPLRQVRVAASNVSPGGRINAQDIIYTFFLYEDHDRDPIFEANLEDAITQSLDTANPAMIKPTSKKIVAALPLLDFDAKLKAKQSDCKVCHDEFDEDCGVISLPCSHLYHRECLLPWLSEHNTCPVCRYELPQEDDSCIKPSRQSSLLWAEERSSDLDPNVQMSVPLLGVNYDQVGGSDGGHMQIGDGVVIDDLHNEPGRFFNNDASGGGGDSSENSNNNSSQCCAEEHSDQKEDPESQCVADFQSHVLDLGSCVSPSSPDVDDSHVREASLSEASPSPTLLQKYSCSSIVESAEMMDKGAVENDTATASPATHPRHLSIDSGHSTALLISNESKPFGEDSDIALWQKTSVLVQEGESSSTAFLEIDEK